MASNRRGWIGWIERNPLFSAVTAFLLGVGMSAMGFLAAEVGVGTNPAGVTVEDPLVGGPTETPTATPTAGETPTETSSPGGPGAATTGGSSTGTATTGTTGGTTGGTSGTTGGTGGSTGATTGGSSGATAGGTTGDPTTGGTTGGTTGTAAACTPDPNYEATGITAEKVVIGQIISDVSQLPQQLRPVRQGLEAFVKRKNAEGGVCGRQIEVQVANDNANPFDAQSAYDRMVREVFAFVGIASLMDGQMYNTQKPFNPRSSDDGEYLPDIGGQAYTYHRAQSPWHGSPLGSLSPVLGGGTAFVGFAKELASEGQECTKGGIVYLVEPTGASEDQARVGQVTIEQPWGMGLGEGNTDLFDQALAASRPQYQLLVEEMRRAGVDCVFTYADLGSNINLVGAASDQGAWPPSECTTRCFKLIYQPYAGYDPQFITQLRGDALGVRSFLPHVPLEETNDPTMAQFLRDFAAAHPNAQPTGTYAVVGYASGWMFADAIEACGAAPTRECVMGAVQKMQDWKGGGVFAPISPFRATRVNGPQPFGEWDFKWVFNCVVRIKVVDTGGGNLAWQRQGPAGFECGDLRDVTPHL